MKKAIYIIVPLALLALLVFKLKSNKTVAEERIYQYDKEQAINVHTQTLDLQELDATHSFTGTFEPDRETKINADMQGKIIALYAEEGSLVQKGKVLIKLDDALLQLQLETVEVQIEGLQADVKRYAILTDAAAIQGVKLEKVELGLRTAEIQKKTLLEKISRTSVRAPFSGVITKKMTEVGAFAAPGLPLFQLTEISRLRFTTNVPEDQLRMFKLNQTFPVRVDAYPELDLTGKIIVVGSKGNPGGSFPVQVRVSNTRNLQIKSGMFGKLDLGEPMKEKRILIPSAAIIGSNIHPQVYLVQDGKAILHDISIEKRIQDDAVIKSGLRKGDEIVIGGFINLFDGANVANH